MEKSHPTQRMFAFRLKDIIKTNSIKTYTKKN